MRTTAFLLSVPLAALLGACSPAEQGVAASPAPEPIPAVPDETNAAPCGANKLSEFVDAVPTEDVLAKIKTQVGDKTIRVINPGDAVTMDFRPDRLNIENGADGGIKKFGCY